MELKSALELIQMWKIDCEQEAKRNSDLFGPMSHGAIYFDGRASAFNAVLETIKENQNG